MNLLEINHQNKTAVGYSIGAYLLMVLAGNLKFKKITLISPSPLFKETQNQLKEIEKLIDMKQCNSTIKDLCKNVDCEVEVFVGENEIDLMKETALKISTELGVQLQIVKGANHQSIIEKLNLN